MPISIILAVASVFIATTALPITIKKPPEPVPIPPPIVVVEVKPDYSREALKKFATQEAKKAGMSEQTIKDLFRTINCESGWQHNVYGDGGRAYSVSQFHRATFNENSLGGEVYENPHDQIRVMIRMWNNDMHSRWTCY